MIGWRVFRFYRQRKVVVGDAMVASLFNIFPSRFAEVAGIFKYIMNRVRGEFRIIEYK